MIGSHRSILSNSAINIQIEYYIQTAIQDHYKEV